MLARRKKARAHTPVPPPVQPQAPVTSAEQAPMYKVEAYKVYDQNVVQEKVYGDEEMRRAYK